MGPVFAVTAQRAAYCSKLTANLMGSSGLQKHAQQRTCSLRRCNACAERIVQNCFLDAAAHRRTGLLYSNRVAFSLVTVEKKKMAQRCAGKRRHPLDYGKIGLLCCMCFHLCTQGGSGSSCFCINDNATGHPVQPVNRIHGIASIGAKLCAKVCAIFFICHRRYICGFTNGDKALIFPKNCIWLHSAFRAQSSFASRLFVPIPRQTKCRGIAQRELECRGKDLVWICAALVRRRRSFGVR